MNFCPRFVTVCPVKSAMCLEDDPIRLKYLWAGDAVMVTYVTTTNLPVGSCQQIHRGPQCQLPRLKVSQTNKSDLLIYASKIIKWVRVIKPVIDIYLHSVENVSFEFAYH